MGTKNAVGLVSKLNGYFGNQAIRSSCPTIFKRRRNWPESWVTKSKWTISSSL